MEKVHENMMFCVNFKHESTKTRFHAIFPFTAYFYLAIYIMVKGLHTCIVQAIIKMKLRRVEFWYKKVQ